MKRKSLIPKFLIGLSLLLLFWGYGNSNPAHALSPKDNEFQNKSNLAQTGNIVFAVIGDYGVATTAESDVANLVKGWNPDFIITVGDNNYPIGSADSIEDNIGQYYHSFISPYQGKYGAGADTNRFFPALGNHDWKAEGAAPYLSFFTLPGNERYYDFVKGPVHFFIIDSDPHEPDGNYPTSIQAKWLRSALAASTSPFNLVFAHHPPYSSGAHGSTSWMQWPYKDWGADAVLAGHDHLYERLSVNGLPYFVNGMGGSVPLYNFQTVLAQSQVRFNQDVGAMRVEASSASIKFQAITRAGVLIDEYSIGTTLPGVTSIRRVHADPSSLPGVDFIVTFSESVSGVDASDFNLVSTNVSGAFISAVAGSGSVYTVSVNSGSGDGTFHLDFIDNDSVINSSGNPSGGSGAGNGNFSGGETYTMDKTVPFVTSILLGSPNPTNANSVDFLLSLSEPVAGLDPTDFNLVSPNSSGASISNVGGSGSSYVVSINTGVGNDSLRLDVIDNDTVVDAAGNSLGGSGAGNGNFTGGGIYTVDKTPPTVTSIIRGNADPTSADTVDFIVTFSELVTGVDAPDFTLTTNLTGAGITAIQDSNPFYIVTVSTGRGTGALRLDFTDNDSVTDMIGNATGGTGIANGNFASGESYAISRSAPSVVSIQRAHPNPTSSEIVDFLVTFSEAVTGVDTPDFSLAGSTIGDALITGISGSGSVYTVSVNTGTGDGIIVLSLVDDDSIINASGNNLGEPGIGNGNFAGGEAYTIVKTAPHVTSIIRASPNPAATATVDFIVTFSESVTGVNAADFAPTSDYLFGTAILGVKNVDPFYIVTVSTGAGTGSLRLDLRDDNSISDLAGNQIGGAGPGNGDFTSGEVFNVARPSINFPAPLTRFSRRLTNDPTPTFSWYPVGGARLYEIVVARDAGFSQLVTSQIGSSLSATINPPLSDGNYFWHVRAYNRNLEPGRFSTTQAFTLDTIAPPVPVLISPQPNTVTNRRPTFTWAASSTAVNYQIDVDNNADFSRPEFSKITNEITVRSGYLPRGTFFWRVRATDAAGNWSGWSGPFTFIIP